MSDAYLAFETGGTKLVAAIADAHGDLVDVRILARQPDDRAARSLGQLIEAARALRAEHEARGAVFRGIGFGYGGQVDRSTRRVLRCPHEEGWEHIDVRAELGREFGLPSVMENDCKLAALAEAGRGAGRGFRTVFYITIGTGIGGGIVRDGRIVEFGDAGEAEVGHITVMPDDGPACGCGKRGCLESVAAGPGLAAFAARLASERAGDWRGNAIARRAVEDAGFSAKDVFAAYERDDAFAAMVLRIVATLLGQALASVIQLINPDVIVFGGGVGASSERFVRMISEFAEPYVMPSLRGRCQFVRTQLRENVVTQGAALLVARQPAGG